MFNPILKSWCKGAAASLLFLVSVNASAVPAKPGLLNFRQASGQTVPVRLVGDENFHFYLTEDGYPLMAEGNTLFYCDITPDGTFVNSRIAATPLAQRSDEARQWLSRVDVSAVERNLDGMASAKAASRNRISPFTKGPGVTPETTFPAYGSQKVLIILVQFPDETFKIDEPSDFFSRMHNQRGFDEYNATGSASDYFVESSSGIFTPQFDVYGPVTLSHYMEYYGGNDMNGNDGRPTEMIEEACRMLDPTVDFSQYDCDGDGYVDNVYVYYAGLSEAAGGSPDCIWPHAWYISQMQEAPMLDGVTVDRYACSNEWNENGTPCGIGTFVHEFSHVLGLPDLYSTSYTGAFTPGAWSVMDVGPYNNDGRTPPLYSAFERYALGWIEPVELTSDRKVTLPDISHNRAALVTTPSPLEYFLIENRQQHGWDEFIPGHGMLVWHIDYNDAVWSGNRVNNLPYHQYVDIVEADGDASYNTIPGDAFPGENNVTSFTGDTNPAFKTWDGLIIPLPITDIAEDADGIIRFKVGDGGSPLTAPKANEAAEITAEGFLASWQPAGEDMGYLLTVATVDEAGERVALPGFSYLDAGRETSYKVIGLEAEQTYSYSVIATDGLDYSQPSDWVDFKTLRRTLAYEKAEAAEAEDVSSRSFTARWLATEGASEYLLSVYTKTEGAPMEESCDFTDGVANLPAGWTSTSSQSYSMASYCGEAVPSLRMSAGDALSTPDFADGVRSFSFWHRGNSTMDSDLISVSALCDGAWTEVSRYPVCADKGGQTVTLEALPERAAAVKITFLRNGDRGSLAVDDVRVGHGFTLVPSFVDGYNPMNASASLSATVDGLTPDTDYFYTVTARDGDEVSRPSDEIAVHTLKASEVDAVEAAGLIVSDGYAVCPEGVEIFVYDSMGRLVARGFGSASLQGAGVVIVNVPALGVSRKVCNIR